MRDTVEVGQIDRSAVEFSAKLRRCRSASALLLLCVATAIATPAQTLTTVANFEGSTSGFSPNAVVQGFDGNFYGTVENAGAKNYGTLFKVTSDGYLTSIDFDDANGSSPLAGVIQATDGNFYGTTWLGGDRGGKGLVFKVTPDGVLTTLYEFCAQANCADGALPTAGLAEGTDGNFYGTTYQGGAYSSAVNLCPSGCGTVFKITPGGILTTLYSFCAKPNCTDGVVPSAGLVQANDGNFYGVAYGGGRVNDPTGTVYRITKEGKLATIYRFCARGGYHCSDGAGPLGTLIQASNGKFYGTTVSGGVDIGGTVFEIGADGVLTTLYRFCSQKACDDGAMPTAGLAQGTDGNFYGTTPSGGTRKAGTLFKLTSTGQFTSLHSFCVAVDCPDGAVPSGTLIQGTDGNFYGVASGGGSDDGGTFFKLDTGLGPFVESVPTSGRIGSEVRILGTNFTGVTQVSFNGTTAVFSEVSGSEIRATVPSGATTGVVTVSSSNGVLTSNVVFGVP
jgi:uncharacterized repeat protein (TIGR03803 family)